MVVDCSDFMVALAVKGGGELDFLKNKGENWREFSGGSNWQFLKEDQTAVIEGEER